MTALSDLVGQSFQRVRAMNDGNIFTGGGLTCLLKPVNRDFEGKAKKPVYYMSAIANGKAQYLSGLFATNDPTIFSADYKDAIGVKHIVHVQFADEGKNMTVKAV